MTIDATVVDKDGDVQSRWDNAFPNPVDVERHAEDAFTDPDLLDDSACEHEVDVWARHHGFRGLDDASGVNGRDAELYRQHAKHDVAQHGDRRIPGLGSRHKCPRTE